MCFNTNLEALARGVHATAASPLASWGLPSPELTFAAASAPAPPLEPGAAAPGWQTCAPACWQPQAVQRAADALLRARLPLSSLPAAAGGGAAGSGRLTAASFRQAAALLHAHCAQWAAALPLPPPPPHGRQHHAAAEPPAAGDAQQQQQQQQLLLPVTTCMLLPRHQPRVLAQALAAARPAPLPFAWVTAPQQARGAQGGGATAPAAAAPELQFGSFGDAPPEEAMEVVQLLPWSQPAEQAVLLWPLQASLPGGVLPLGPGGGGAAAAAAPSGVATPARGGGALRPRQLGWGGSEEEDGVGWLPVYSQGMAGEGEGGAAAVFGGWGGAGEARGTAAVAPSQFVQAKADARRLLSDLQALVQHEGGQGGAVPSSSPAAAVHA